MFRLASVCEECKGETWTVPLPSPKRDATEVELSPRIPHAFKDATIKLSTNINEPMDIDHSLFWRKKGDAKWIPLGHDNDVSFQVPAHTTVEIRATKGDLKEILEIVPPLCFGVEKSVELPRFERDPWPHPDTEEWTDWRTYYIPRTSLKTSWTKLYEQLKEKCGTMMDEGPFFDWLVQAERNHALRRLYRKYQDEVEIGVPEDERTMPEIGGIVYYPSVVRPAASRAEKPVFPAPPPEIPEAPSVGPADPPAEPVAESAADPAP